MRNTRDFMHETNRIALLGDDNELLAEVTFPYADASSHVVDVTHTFVDPSLRGRHIAGRLMEELVKDLRKNHLKAKLTCSYAIKWFRENEKEYGDLLKK